MSDDAPDPQRLIKLARQTLSAAERRRKYQRIDFLGTDFWYPTQLAFFAAGSSGVHQTLDLWRLADEARRCAARPRSLASDRRLPALVDRQAFQQADPVLDRRQVRHAGARHDATPAVRRRRQVRHRAWFRWKVSAEADHGHRRPAAIDTFPSRTTDGKIDGTSTATFKTFEMRRERLQSETVDLIWIDERPDEQIYSELYARTSACDGHLIVSYTPIGEGAAAGCHLQVPERAIGRSQRVSHHRRRSQAHLRRARTRSWPPAIAMPSARRGWRAFRNSAAGRCFRSNCCPA